MFDLIVLGGGPGGYKAAENAAKAGLSVCLFEKRAVGGVCLNEGCIPSKALLYSAKLYDYAKGGAEKYGVTSENAILDYKAAVERKDKVVKTLVGGIEATLKSLKVTVIREEAAIEGKTSDGFKVGGQIGRNLIIATGSETIIPSIKNAETCLTNREILSLTEIPETLAVIGGGVIGLEMVSLFNSIGSKVTVYEALDKIGGPLDREISIMLQKIYEKKGVTFYLGAAVKDAAELGAEKTLLSVGRKASTKNIGLETLNVYLERGAVVTDAQMRTNVPNIYAVGDVNGKSMLAHTAYREADVAVNAILGKRDEMRYDAIPSVIYTNPEVASCGETLETAVEKGYKAVEKKISLKYSGRFVAENDGGDGICKLVVNNSDNRVMGIHILGNPASEIISAAAVAIERKMTVEQLKTVVFPHPSVGEIIAALL
ncbi:MAG: dihydrolipoyl dehydrogenase [Oscillospiraceae bacterium]|jgi:dihydrolipoamide dehydrogenase|nr:dihydrolipoyl dehydrogenase [Oscillospiraceae bacterium]